jgi:O-antigen ligase
VRAAGERLEGFAAVLVCFCALFGGGGLSVAPLVWIGAIVLLAAALLLRRAAPLGGAGNAYVGCLLGLAVWCGLSILWSASPDRSWSVTNRTLVYAGFALVGVLAGARVARERIAAAATGLAAAVVCWGLLAKCIASLYPLDSGPLSVARLHEPLGEWNMEALVCVVGLVLALWLGARARLAGVVLVYACVVALLLTYSRFGVALACVVAAAWLLLERDRVESIAALAVGGGAGAAVFAAALALPGITNDAESRGVRAHDGWIFGLVLLGGAAAVAVVALLLLRLPPPTPAHRRIVERAAAGLAVVAALGALVVVGVKAHTIWSQFTSSSAGQTVSNVNRLGQAGSGNRWTWWSEAWSGFTAHPAGGTGAGTFQLTDLRLRQSSDITTTEPHNVPLQFLSETGIVGLLLYLGAAAAALRAGFRRRDRASRALALAVAAFFAHTVLNFDWDYVGVCGPMLLLGGVLVAREPAQAGAPVRRPLLALGAAVFALGCVYSLAAPWLAQRALAANEFQRARSYDPLSTDALVDLAYVAPTNAQALQYFSKAVSLEPTNGAVWFELATYYADEKQWENAYQALSKAYAYDPFGPAGQCGLAAKVRREVGINVKSCRGSG